MLFIILKEKICSEDYKHGKRKKLKYLFLGPKNILGGKKKNKFFKKKKFYN
jgi:hypothetical protein